MGPSGSGKTTLLNILSTIDRPTAGTVILEGQDIARLSNKELSKLRRDRIGFVFQDYNLLDTMTLEDNIALPLSLNGVSGKRARESVAELAREAGLEFTLPEPEDDQIIKLSHLYLMSLITDRSDVMVTILGKAYRQIEESSIPYLGYLQESVSFYLVNDREYENLLPLGEEMYAGNYRISHLEDFAGTKESLDEFLKASGRKDTARVA